jgi:hypothetical protein
MQAEKQPLLLTVQWSVLNKHIFITAHFASPHRLLFDNILYLLMAIFVLESFLLLGILKL